MEDKSKKALKVGSVVIPGIWYQLPNKLRFILEQKNSYALEGRVLSNQNKEVGRFSQPLESSAKLNVIILNKEIILALMEIMKSHLRTLV